MDREDRRNFTHSHRERSNRHDPPRDRSPKHNHKRHRGDADRDDVRREDSKRRKRPVSPLLLPRMDEWDGVLGLEDDIEFDLAADWDPYRRTVTKMLFGRGGFLAGERSTQEDFWNFLARLRANFERLLNREGKTGVDVYTVKTPLKKLHLELKNFNLVHRLRLIRGDDECEEIPIRLLKIFHYGVICYLDFLEKQDFGKLKKLRQSQANLPIANYHQRIVDLIRVNPIVIVSGDTGCGKSTQVPQYLLKAGYDKICCTQPRRIACISLSKRVAYETLNEYGSQVAYQIRFEKTKTARTRIVFMTEGLLLRQMGSDPTLSQYSVLVLDEVHERHLHSDFLLGVVRGLVEQRPDLRIILMSATINIELFAKYFNQAPVLQVPGRLYPIQVHYSPISVESRSSATSRFNPGPYVRILEMIDNKYPVKERGDVLVFLSGINEITTLVEAAGVYAEKTRKWIILSLHSSLSLAEQDKVFDIAPEGVRKCIVSTNIAETSVTIDGIRFVLDSGRVKEMSFDAKYHMQRLQEFWISQASAEQRRGRAGRTGPGVCYRMYQQSDYDAFALYSTPEIQRVPLDSLILQMISMGLTAVREFPFIEPPSSITIEQCMASLKNHGALTSSEELTRCGRTLANLPLDVAIGKILISGTLITSLLEPVLFITAALSIQSPFTNRAFRDLDSKALLEKNFSNHGDSLTLLQVFHAWLEEKMKSSDRSDGSRRWCRKRGVEEQRMYEITKLCAQFREILQEHGLLNSKKLMEDILADRAKRTGEVKQLRFLKRTAQRSKKGRKVLSLDNDAGASDEEKDSGEVDIQDVEFQLQNDRSNIEDMFDATGNLSDQEIRIMKLILSSGFYPNFALADDCNSFKADQDQIFHTRSKPYVVLHPTSVFAFQPEWLAVPETDMPPGGLGRKGHYSDRHQLLVYASLLETNKPYLMNCMRIPALHALLLFAVSVDTNVNATRLVFDGFFDVYVPDAADALAILESSVWIRSIWKQLLDLRLIEAQMKSVEVGRSSRGITKALENDLIAKLSDYVSTSVTFAIKRLLAADMRVLYTGVPCDDSAEPISTHDVRKTTVKGGVEILEYLTYNCLTDSAVSPDEVTWVCSSCDESFNATVLDRLAHFVSCTSNSKTYENFKDTGEEEKQRNALDTDYYCDVCQKKLSLTPVEILRHRKTHLSDSPYSVS